MSEQIRQIGINNRGGRSDFTILIPYQFGVFSSGTDRQKIYSPGTEGASRHGRSQRCCTC